MYVFLDLFSLTTSPRPYEETTKNSTTEASVTVKAGNSVQHMKASFTCVISLTTYLAFI